MRNLIALLFLFYGLSPNIQAQSTQNMTAQSTEGIAQEQVVEFKGTIADQKKTYPIRIGKKTAEGIIVDFKKVKKDTMVYDQPKDTTAPGFEYSNQLLFPKKTTKYHWLTDSLRKSDGIKDHQSVEGYLVQDMKGMVKNYQDAVSGAEHPEYESWNWDYNNDQSVGYNDHNYLSIFTSGYEFMGGAHGVSWFVYNNYDLKNKCKVQLSDILTINSTQISELLEKSFRQEQGVKPDEPFKDFGLFEDTIKPNNNFYFDDWGLTFVYNQYEIGPYVMGDIQIFIPWEDLEAYLKVNFQNRMGLAKASKH